MSHPLDPMLTLLQRAHAKNGTIAPFDRNVALREIEDFLAEGHPMGGSWQQHFWPKIRPLAAHLDAMLKHPSLTLVAEDQHKQALQEIRLAALAFKPSRGRPRGGLVSREVNALADFFQRATGVAPASTKNGLFAKFVGAFLTATGRSVSDATIERATLSYIQRCA